MQLSPHVLAGDKPEHPSGHPVLLGLTGGSLGTSLLTLPVWIPASASVSVPTVPSKLCGLPGVRGQLGAEREGEGTGCGTFFPRQIY